MLNFVSFDFSLEYLVQYEILIAATTRLAEMGATIARMTTLAQSPPVRGSTKRKR
ncbi:MAG: hypothetical protein ACKVQA_26375 [Burkholderiales bacterium]